MIRNIIFDIGNVLTLFHPEDYIHAVFDKERAARLYKALFESGRWYEIDTGSKTDEEMIQSFLQEEPAWKRKSVFSLTTSMVSSPFLPPQLPGFQDCIKKAILSII